eukprot:CAMPEP_0198274222 /NCGR_PEP_ID=MMETSP1447-20131203/59576_1 /TAXON_ID=420782 /ORGANISM="Chaetoceros dichaeta, Strain CCMP1751" /LENGTH=86 /DNA_ID=CAMNT_0043968267 /DNA_START=1 /DNA_END=258 /DNA_ORIENTATION=+
MILRGLVQLLSHIVPPLELYHHLTFILQRRRRQQRECGDDDDCGRSPTLAMYWSGLNYVVGGGGSIDGSWSLGGGSRSASSAAAPT